MVKTFALFFVFLTLISCGKDKEDKKSGTASVQTSTLSSNDVPALARSFDINAKMVNFSSENKQKVQKAIELIKKIVASDQFRERVLNKTYEGQKTFVNNNGLTNEEIYLQILEASEKLNPGENNVMDVELELYYEENTTVGYTYPSVMRIYMNTKYFDKFTPAQVADNLVHEWLHKIGFDHAVVYSPSRDHSVPYAIGYLVRELAKKIQ